MRPGNLLTAPGQKSMSKNEIYTDKHGPLAIKLTDPLATTVPWEPLERGGTNFQAQRLELSEQTAKVKRTGSAKILAALFALGGLGIIARVAVPAVYHGDIVSAIGGFIVGGLSSVVGFGLSSSMRGALLIFDKASARYYAHPYRDRDIPPVERDKGGKLADIHALQILVKRVRGSHRSLTSYELNLVFPNGERVNVMNHGHRQALEQAAVELPRFLDVPVWSAI